MFPPFTSLFREYTAKLQCSNHIVPLFSSQSGFSSSLVNHILYLKLLVKKKFAFKFCRRIQGVFSLIPTDIFIRLKNFLNIVGKLQTNVIWTKSNKKLIHSIKSAVTLLKSVSKHKTKTKNIKYFSFYMIFSFCER